MEKWLINVVLTRNCRDKKHIRDDTIFDLANVVLVEMLSVLTEWINEYPCSVIVSKSGFL